MIKLFALILDKPTEHPDFAIKNGLIWQINQHFDEVMCIPHNWDTITQILDQSHTILGHFGDQRTNEYTWQWYWWPLMNKVVHEFCQTCESCQQAKGSNTKPLEKLHTLPVPIKPWYSIGMDFIGPFPESKNFNYLWVIICWMTSMVHLIPGHTKMKASELSYHGYTNEKLSAYTDSQAQL